MEIAEQPKHARAYPKLSLCEEGLLLYMYRFGMLSLGTVPPAEYMLFLFVIQLYFCDALTISFFADRKIALERVGTELSSETNLQDFLYIQVFGETSSDLPQYLASARTILKELCEVDYINRPVRVYQLYVTLSTVPMFRAGIEDATSQVVVSLINKSIINVRVRYLLFVSHSLVAGPGADICLYMATYARSLMISEYISESTGDLAEFSDLDTEGFRRDILYFTAVWGYLDFRIVRSALGITRERISAFKNRKKLLSNTAGSLLAAPLLRLQPENHSSFDVALSSLLAGCYKYGMLLASLKI